MKKILSNKAFTLIELLVVISIIGMLSSVVLASLGTAREKGKLASVKTFATHNYRKLGANIVFHADFNEGTGNIAKDKAGNFQDTASSPTRVNDDPYLGSSGYSLTRNATFTNTRNISLDDSSGITESAWFNFNGSLPGGPSNTFLVGTSRINSTHYANLYFNYYARQIVCSLGNDTALYIVSTSIFTDYDSNWHNVVCTYDVASNKTTLYFDGKEAGSYQFVSTPLVPAYISNNVTVGYFNNSLTAIDDVQIMSGSLLASEVERLYAQGLEKLKIAGNVGNTK